MSDKPRKKHRRYLTRARKLTALRLIADKKLKPSEIAEIAGIEASDVLKLTVLVFRDPTLADPETAAKRFVKPPRKLTAGRKALIDQDRQIYRAWMRPIEVLELVKMFGLSKPAIYGALRRHLEANGLAVHRNGDYSLLASAVGVDRPGSREVIEARTAAMDAAAKRTIVTRESRKATARARRAEAFRLWMVPQPLHVVGSIMGVTVERTRQLLNEHLADRTDLPRASEGWISLKAASIVLGRKQPFSRKVAIEHAGMSPRGGCTTFMNIAKELGLKLIPGNEKEIGEAVKAARLARLPTSCVHCGTKITPGQRGTHDLISYCSVSCRDDRQAAACARYAKSGGRPVNERKQGPVTAAAAALAGFTPVGPWVRMTDIRKATGLTHMQVCWLARALKPPVQDHPTEIHYPTQKPVIIYPLDWFEKVAPVYLAAPVSGGRRGSHKQR